MQNDFHMKSIGGYNKGLSLLQWNQSPSFDFLRLHGNRDAGFLSRHVIEAG